MRQIVIDWPSTYHWSEIMAIALTGVTVGLIVGILLFQRPEPRIRGQLSNNPYWESIEELYTDIPYQRRHRIIAKYASLLASSICLCPGLPLIGSVWSNRFDNTEQFNHRRILTKMTATPESHEDDNRTWIVVSQYTTVKE